MDVHVSALTKRYGDQVAVDRVDLDVRTGEVVGFLGPNGAGKTTTMKAICGLIVPDHGQITVGGTPVTKDPNSVRANIGYLPENNPLYEDMPVLDLLQFTARIQGVPESRVKDRVGAMVKECGLEQEKHKIVGELSKGYRQRVGLAQAMVHDPQVLILDEPTTGLDPNQIVEIRELIRSLGQSKTVILSTHILPEVEATCDRILIIDRGRIVANGTPKALRDQARGKALFQARILASDPQQVLLTLNSSEKFSSARILDDDQCRYELTLKTTEDPGTLLFHLCQQHGWVLSEAIPRGHRLEDVFRDLTMSN
ncbi:MAG: ATP-binding cassette domain-containing protein [Flavobacteriales bacterium]|nr:ATP-binding cassette domain-containing protein [Flavobacteriales bacterium]